MTHYEVKYEGTVEDAATRAKAIADIKDYLSERQWLVLMDSIKAGATPTQVDRMLWFTGVKGFPVFAFIRQFMPEQYQAWYDALPED